MWAQKELANSANGYANTGIEMDARMNGFYEEARSKVSLLSKEGLSAQVKSVLEQVQNEGCFSFFDKDAAARVESEKFLKTLCLSILSLERALLEEEKAYLFSYLTKAVHNGETARKIGVLDAVLPKLAAEIGQSDENAARELKQRNRELLQFAAQFEEEEGFFEQTAAKIVQNDASLAGALTERAMALMRGASPRGVVFAMALLDLGEAKAAVSVLLELAKYGKATPAACFVHRLLLWGRGIEKAVFRIFTLNLERQKLFFADNGNEGLKDYVARLYFLAVRAFGDAGFYEESAALVLELCKGGWFLAQKELRSAFVEIVNGLMAVEKKTAVGLGRAAKELGFKVYKRGDLIFIGQETDDVQTLSQAKFGRVFLKEAFDWQGAFVGQGAGISKETAGEKPQGANEARDAQEALVDGKGTQVQAGANVITNEAAAVMTPGGEAQTKVPEESGEEVLASRATQAFKVAAEGLSEETNVSAAMEALAETAAVTAAATAGEEILHDVSQQAAQEKGEAAVEADVSAAAALEVSYEGEPSGDNAAIGQNVAAATGALDASVAERVEKAAAAAMLKEGAEENAAAEGTTEAQTIDGVMAEGTTGAQAIDGVMAEDISGAVKEEAGLPTFEQWEDEAYGALSENAALEHGEEAAAGSAEVSAGASDMSYEGKPSGDNAAQASDVEAVKVIGGLSEVESWVDEQEAGKPEGKKDAGLGGSLNKININNILKINSKEVDKHFDKIKQVTSLAIGRAEEQAARIKKRVEDTNIAQSASVGKIKALAKKISIFKKK